MGAGIFNMLVGAVMVIGGASGKLALFGTQSGAALAAIGGVVAAIGLWQVIRSSRRG
jgi:hypothetical protein